MSGLGIEVSQESVVVRLLDETLIELGHEENKAARILAALTVTSGALVAGFFAGRWRPASTPDLDTVLWAGGGLGLVLSLLFVGMAVVAKPATSRASAPSVHQFHAGLAAYLRDNADASMRLWSAQCALAAKRRLLSFGLAFAGVGISLSAIVGITA